MKRLNLTKRMVQMAFMMVAMLTMVGCSSNSDFLDDWENGNDTGNGNGDSGASGTTVTPSSSISDLTSFDISIDKTVLTESEAIPTEGDEAEDYIENNTFSNTVSIAFNGTSATTSGSVDNVTVTINGADVIVNSSAKKVRYIVSGSTSDGFLKIYSDNKFALELNGVSITNPDGAPLNIQSKNPSLLL